MMLSDIEKELESIRSELLEDLLKIERLQSQIREEIQQRERVELFLIPKRRRGKKAGVPAGAYAVEKYPELYQKRKESPFAKPCLYDRMKECGFNMADIKALFGKNTRVMAKIAYGTMRFTDYEAEILSDLFQLSEAEKAHYFWRGLIPTDKHPVD